MREMMLGGKRDATGRRPKMREMLLGGRPRVREMLLGKDLR
jgi:hypothetical protein